MQGLLIVNPNATTTNDRVREVIVQALSNQVDLEVVNTQAKGHARQLGETALRERLDVVITLGGDGTVNEAINGMLVDGPGAHVPALAMVPGGSGNVLVRSAGIPSDPVEATGLILDGLADHRYRTISLGTANGRWFAMSLGMGMDAEIIASMEEQRSKGKQAGPTRYLGTTLRQYFARTNRKDPALTITRPGCEEIDHVFIAIVQNAAPWTFFGSFPVNPLPEASFDHGMSVFAIRNMHILPSLRWSRRILASSRAGSANGLFVAHDIEEMTIAASRPTAVQIDGEALGALNNVVIKTVPQAIRLVV